MSEYSSLHQTIIDELKSTKNYQILERVPQYATFNHSYRDSDKLNWLELSIIDLETTGLDYKKDKITEIGIINFLVHLSQGSQGPIHILNVYQSFNDPGVQISEKITQLTGIDNEMVKDKKIDWIEVSQLIQDSEFIICHNAAFDRKFLEKAYEDNVVFKNKQFACSKNDINWSERGYGSNKLDYLNWKLGYFYDGHRAINDCWATLNILIQDKEAMQEMICNARDTIYEVYAVNAPFQAKDLLKDNGFYWNDGNNGKPKAWYKVTKDKEDTIYWLTSNKLCYNPPTVAINAAVRYSDRV